MNAYYVDTVFLRRHFGQFFSHAGGATIKEVAIVSTGLLKKCRHQLGPIDTALEFESAPAPEPDQRHAIWDNQIRGLQDRHEIPIMLGFAHAMHAGDGHVFWSLALAIQLSRIWMTSGIWSGFTPTP